MTAYLQYKDGKDLRKLPCRNVIAIGRDRNNDVVLSDPRVSRNHALIRMLSEGGFYLIDSGSSNGSFVNDQRVRRPVLLKNRDRLVIGETRLMFREERGGQRYIDSIYLQQTVVVQRPMIREVTLLVADMRGFSGLSERVPIEVLTKLMNRWFHDVSSVILENGGMVDKFIGDCVFARWDGDDPRTNSIRALRTALALSTVTAAVTRSFGELPHPLRIGVGINTGKVSTGIGTDATVLGDAVNVAFRLESITKLLRKDLVLSRTSYKYVPPSFWKGQEKLIRLRGREKPVRAWGLDFTQLPRILKVLESG